MVPQGQQYDDPGNHHDLEKAVCREGILGIKSLKVVTNKFTD